MKKKKILLASLGIFILVLATVGVTFAVFTYTKLGTTENTVTTGTLKFLYTENTGVGNGINIENAFPVSDEVGKTYNTDKYVFDFSVEATNSGVEEIPYEVTLRKKNTSTLGEKYVKTYLTDMTEDADTTIINPTLYSDLSQTTIDVGEEIEKTIYNGTVLGGELTYKKDFRLRMWIDEASNQDDINGKTFIALVNVYSNVPLVSQEELDSRNSTEISKVIINESIAEKVESDNYDYEITLPTGTTSATINVEAANSNADVKIEKIDSLSYNNSNIKKIASLNITDLTSGDNYFKITITNANKTNSQEYVLKIVVLAPVKLEGFAKQIYDANPLVTTEPSLKNTSDLSGDPVGLYKSTATNDGRPTYYFRGKVENNYVDFAGFTWRIIRINEDGTIRMILSNTTDSWTVKYLFNSDASSLEHMYYSNSTVKTTIETWYKSNLATYSDSIEENSYYCEQAKVKTRRSSGNPGNVIMPIADSYTPDFICKEDANGYGIVNSYVGLITYDEAIFAGGKYASGNTSFYLWINAPYLTMSPAGMYSSSVNTPYVWVIGGGSLQSYAANDKNFVLRPVINLKSNVTVTGTGESDNHYKVQ